MTTPVNNLGAQRIVILGAQSAIAEATARLYAGTCATILLAGRNSDRLRQIADDLVARGAAKVVPWVADLAATERPDIVFSKMIEAIGGNVDAVMVFYGVLGNQQECAAESRVARAVLDTNFTSAALWCLAAADCIERQKSGVLLVISSVAGDRGRQSNYVYGAAKAGLSVLVEGIAHRLAPVGAYATVVKLGFVDTPMTAHIKKGGPLWASPDGVARTLKKIASRPTKPIVYVPWFWRPIMTVIRNVPVAVFHKTKL